ncbi:TolC family protein [Flavobacteriaceae bacterium S356]|uniref:TolC family protein n=1 Tax=Asprobacillus argus TaxID=3076534 RepID=A0ABU3LCI2_9FLAO|nr:TolC family protein [Flavobacteriaceae bacterium S356]
MKVRANICMLLISLFLTFQSNAQTKAVSFQELLREGFKNNYAIKLENLNVDKATYTLLRANGFLNPYLDSEVVYGSGVDPTITNNGTQYFQTNFVLPTKLGIDFYSGARLERTDLIQESFILNSSGAWVGATIPLLRGLGKSSAANTFIETSKINEKALKEQFSNQVLIYFNEMLLTYLTLQENTKRYEIEQNTLAEAKKYHEYIYSLAKNDQIPQVEKNRADAFVEQKTQQVTIANLDALGTYYSTRMLLGNNAITVDSIPNLMDVIPDPNKEKMITYIAARKFNLETLVKNTPQYRNIALRVEENKLLLKNAQNQKRNQLDLDVKVSRFGMIQNGGYNFSNTLRSTYPGYSVLVSLTHNLPISNQKQRGAYLEQLTELDISKTFLEQYIFENVVSAKLNITLLEQKIELFEQTKKIVALTKQNYLDEKEKFKLGSSTQIDITLSFDNYFTAMKSLNTLKYDIWRNYVSLKFKLGELPNNEQELNEFTLLKLF